MELHSYADDDMMMMAVANVLADDIRTRLAVADRAAIAVAGGATPGPVFDYLAHVDLDWARVDVMLTDERWVDPGSARSNTRLLTERLFAGKAAEAVLIPLYDGAQAPEDGLEALSGPVRAALPLASVLLGMGEDMHTASLFPDGDQIDAAMSPDAPVLMAMRAPGVPEPRVTLTFPVIEGAIRKHLVIRGAAKKAALDRAQALDDPQTAPISAFLSELDVHWCP
ncbi:MAG: 6-phosphogluconolactonase [Rhodobacterales bacterium]|nr:MAG: 6-phosphogluconolactonase [Rhodobacterales bacterium]PIE09224.1 MAG: 6-phosphogluconolactonase [Rhodobacterales bacterium]